MRYDLCTDASAQIQQICSGALRLEHDAAGVYLVEVATGVRVQILQAIDNSGGVNGDRFHAVTQLSQREQEVFAMLGRGLDMAQIAQRMTLSVKTIETYRARIKQKLDIKHRAQLLALAVEWHLDGRANGGNGKPSQDGESNAAPAQRERRLP